MTVLTYKWLNVLIQNDHIIIALEKTPIVFKKKKEHIYNNQMSFVSSKCK